MFTPSLKQIHLAYEDGWNSFNEGVDYFHNPFSVKHKELHNSWKLGWESCRTAWLSPETKIINNKPIKTPLPV